MSALLAGAAVHGMARASVDAGGTSFPAAIETGQQRLELSGAGVYRKMMFRVYANALYLPPGTPRAAVLDETPRCLVFHYFREISPEQFREAAAPYLEKNLTEAQLAAIREPLQRMNRLYQAVEEGDRYRLCYRPGEGTSLALNGRMLGSVAGDEFARAYFRIWLGENSLDNDLRDRMMPDTAPRGTD